MPKMQRKSKLHEKIKKELGLNAELFFGVVKYLPWRQTTFFGALLMNASTLSMAVFTSRLRASVVAQAMCGVK